MTSKFDNVEADKIEVEQLQVGRHVRMRSDLGGIDIHVSDKVTGIWVTPNNTKAPCGTAGIFIDHGKVRIAVYPDYPTKSVQFAISSDGLQVVTKDGRVRILPLEKIAELVDKLMTE